MPIWRSSELVVGRAGSPNRRSSARSSSSQPNSNRNSALPPLRLSGDGTGTGAGSELQQPAASTNAQYPQGLARQTSSRKAASGCASVSSISSWEASQAATMGSCPPYPVAGLPVSEQQAPSWQSSTSGTTPRRRVSAADTYGMTVQTYTVQYIGIAHGELGILSQKQKLAPQRSSGSGNTPSGVAPSAAGGAAAAGGPQRRSRSAAPTPPPAPASVPASLSSRGSSAALPTASYTSPTAYLQEGAAAPVSAAVPAPLGLLGPPAEAALGGSHGYAPPGAHLLQRQASLVQATSGRASPPLEAVAAGDPAAASAPSALRPPRSPLPAASGPESAGHEVYGLPRAPSPAHGDVATYTAFAEVAGGGAAPDSVQTPKPPSLVSIVDDARGQVKVITECFFSRALHSRAAPHDRHTRRNRPLGPQVRDMEPLSTALPNRFAHRAPSAGGFSGRKLSTPSGTAAVASGSTATTAANALAGLRSTATGSGSTAAASAATAAGGCSAPAAAAAAAAATAAAARRHRNSSGSTGRAPVGVASGSMLTGSSQAAASGGAGFGPWGDDGAATRPASRGASGAMLKHQVQ